MTDVVAPDALLSHVETNDPPSLEAAQLMSSLDAFYKRLGSTRDASKDMMFYMLTDPSDGNMFEVPHALMEHLQKCDKTVWPEAAQLFASLQLFYRSENWRPSAPGG